MMHPQYWSRWSEAIRRGHLTSVVLALLEGLGGFRSLIAQGMLAVTPFVSTSSGSWQAFAEMLEDQHTTRAFADHLRGEGA